MGLYRIRVSTGSSLCAGSQNQVQLWLVGQHGEAEIRKRLRPARGQVSRARGQGSLQPGRSAQGALRTCSRARPFLGPAVRPPVPSILKSCRFKPPPLLLGVRPAGFLGRMGWRWGRRRR